MEFDLEKFREAPTAEQLFHCSKAQLMSVVEHCCIETASISLKKDELRARVVTALSQQGVLLSESEVFDLSDPVKVAGSKSEAVKLQTQDVQSVHLQELELQFKINQLEIEAKDREEGRKLEMARLQLVHEERMKELEMR